MSPRRTSTRTTPGTYDRTLGRTLRIAFLAVLYLVEGLPFGFQTQALPLVLRGQGASLPQIGGLELLALPWLLKPLIAVLVDRYPGGRLGRRRGWLLPAQIAAVTVALGAAFASSGHGLGVVLASLFALNACAAVLDVAVDALAVDLLPPEELGLGNAAQVAGYKVGMLAGGWALGSLLAGWGFRGVFLAMAAAMLAVLVATLFFREPGLAGPTPPPAPRLREILARVRDALVVPGGAWLLVIVGTYKLGESLIDPMFKIYVVDSGHRPKDVLVWFAAAGIVASIAGSIAGGLLASRIGVWRALVLAAALRLGPLAFEWWLAGAPASPGLIKLAVVLENFFGGALTTTLFAYMMARVDRRIGATHFAFLAELEALGKIPAAALSGVLAASVGYANAFGIGVALSALYLGLLGLAARAKLAAP